MTVSERVKWLEAIAKGLGPEWSADAEPYERGGSITHTNGASVFVSEHWTGKKGEASGSFPRGIDGECMSAASWGVVGYGCAGPEIGFNPKKDPLAIAKDIERRLLPEYLPLWTKVQIKLKVQSDHRAAVKAVVADLVETSDVRDRGADGCDRFCDKYGEAFDFEGTVYDIDNISLTINLRELDKKQVKAVLKALRKAVPCKD